MVDETIETRDPRVYEIGYMILPTVGDAHSADVVATIKKTIAHHGGSEISEGNIELVTLAYPMSKTIENKRHMFQTAYFNWLKFEVTPEKLASIKAMLDSNGDLLRYLLMSTVREDTMAKKRPLRRRTDGGRQDEEETSVDGKTSTDEVSAGASTPAPAAVVEEKVDEKELDEKLETIVS